VSVVIPVQGNLQQPISVKLDSTSEIDMLSLAADTTRGFITVVGVIIVNQDGSAQKVTVSWNDGTTSFALFERSIPANETITVALDAPIALYTKTSARKIKAQAAKADVVTVTLITLLANQRAPS